MSLVAYDASSGEESDYEDDEGSKVIIITNNKTAEPDAIKSPPCDEDFLPQIEEHEKPFVNNLSKLLPKPKQQPDVTSLFEVCSKPKFSELPNPKVVVTQNNIQEVEDEFLLKKPSVEKIEKPSRSTDLKKTTVKITVPALKNFQDVDKEIAEKARNKNNASNFKTARSSGLLSILPKAKSEQTFSKEEKTANSIKGESQINTPKPAKPSFVPDSVKLRRAATNIEDIERVKQPKKHFKNQKIKDFSPIGTKADNNDESDDDNEIGDFFSLKNEQSLPEVSAAEINSLVAQKAAKMIEASTKFLQSSEQKSVDEKVTHSSASRCDISDKRSLAEKSLDSDALRALVGSSTKRRRQEQSNIQVIDLDSSQVMPNKDEWMRTALASSTTYQPTGVLVDEEPASGTRRKHQITYLAHKAKANEAELQAMWSANRQNRRATQSKYGF